MFLLNFIGFFSGRFVDLGYLRYSLLAGCTLQVLGAFTTAFCTEYWQIFLAQGVCSGMGHGFLFAPIVSILPTYFKKNRAFAVSLATCGAATGGMVFPSIAYVALPSYGFRWTVLIMAIVITFNSIVILAVTRTRVAVRKPRSLFDLRAFKELWYSFFAAGSFLTLWGVYFAYFYVSYGNYPLYKLVILTGILGWNIRANSARLLDIYVPLRYHSYEWGWTPRQSHSCTTRRSILWHSQHPHPLCWHEQHPLVRLDRRHHHRWPVCLGSCIWVFGEWCPGSLPSLGG